MYCVGLFLAVCVFEVKSLNWVASVVSAALMFILFAAKKAKLGSVCRCVFGTVCA